MASVLVGRENGAGAGDRLLVRVAENGSAAHAYPTCDSLLRGEHAARNLSDAVHFLCTLHGRHPGVVDHAANRSVDPLTRQWFNEAIPAFAAERAFLTRLAVAAGPVPGTPGAAGAQGTLISQRRALETLAQSERNGCALGAALAIALDWVTIRRVLDIAGERFGIDAGPYGLGDFDAIHALATEAAATVANERAILFGAEQILFQHFGLWDLLEARQQARDAA
jgi:hypothetical protein